MQSKSSPKSKTYFLGIGLNEVDPRAYQGWDGKLVACHNDVLDWQGVVAKRRKVATHILLLDGDATVQKVALAYETLAEMAQAGDQVIIVRSGHGSNARDVDGDEPDGRDELHVLYDGMVSDDQHAIWLSKFRAGVEGTLIFDTCHSETAAKAAMPIEGADAGVMTAPAKWRPKFLPREIAQRLAPPKVVGETPVIASTWRTLGACRDNQVAYDGDVNGAFTAAALAILRKGWRGTYTQFMKQVRDTVKADQTPTLAKPIGGTASKQRIYNSRYVFE